jgi:alanyl-tRNA synthetase
MPSHGSTQTAYTSAKVRQQFIDYFTERAGHTFVPSSPVVPHDDPTLLFTNAGMNQFKPAFLGQIQPGSPLEGLSRAVNSQKCIRAGGKHNDLDDVGKDTYHHTFFEMLGNWSFGDYFKAEAIEWAWELLTKVWELDPSRLYATYFEGDAAQGLAPDEEAKLLWLKYLPPERVLPGDAKDNFWEMGDTGPCGPCSELHYDGRDDEDRAAVDGATLVNQDNPDVIEIWNLVFIQFDRQPGGLKPLPDKHVDTGMGLERIVRVLQGKNSNYDTDLFTHLFNAIERVTGAPAYTGRLKDQHDIAYRVIADHIRTLSFSIADGAEPSNEGRGYVLRRVLRRAVRYGRQTLGVQGEFFWKLVGPLAEAMGEFYPELVKHQGKIEQIIREEELSFGRTLEQGIKLFEDALITAGQEVFDRAATAAGRDAMTRSVSEGDGDADDYVVNQLPLPSKPGLSSYGPQDVDWRSYKGPFRPEISAEDAFKLHDTYGFPIDLTQLMAEEKGLAVDVEGFHRLMEEARERSRQGSGPTGGTNLLLPTDAVARLKHLHIKPTRDGDKFHARQESGTIKAIWNGTDFDEHVSVRNNLANARYAVVLDKTCFYAEMGGQVGDTGRIRVSRPMGGNSRNGEFEVEATHNCGGYIVHIGRVRKGELRIGDGVIGELDQRRRSTVEAHHTATHLLNHALREVLGEGVEQKGSLVAPDRLRFDFSHAKPLTEEQAARVQALVQEKIDADLAVHADTVPLEEGKRVNGLRAVFGETYPDPVRVVSIGAPIEDLLREPSSDTWRAMAIEFCGGTHLKSTGQAEAFILTGEESVSKGVRRLGAITGKPAVEARERATRLFSRLRGASELPVAHLSAELQEITDDIDATELPLVARTEMRALIEVLQEKIKEANKAKAAEGRDLAVAKAREIAENTTATLIVAELPEAGTDRQALLAAMDAIRSRHPESGVLLIGVDEGEDKLAIVAKVPDSLIKRGLKAGDWVRAASEACGGKGGGKPDSAQGGGTGASKAGLVNEAASDFARSAITN